MTNLFEEAVARARELSEDEQDRAAEVLLVLAYRHRRYTLTEEQIEGVTVALDEADRGEFASADEVKNTFDGAL